MVSKALDEKKSREKDYQPFDHYQCVSVIMCVTGAAIILAQSFRRFGDKESVPAVFSFKISEFFLDEDNGDIRESENRFGSKKIFLVMLPYKVDQWLGCHLHFCDNI